MKKLISVLLVFVLLFALAMPALASDSAVINFVLKNGVNGKKSTDSARKGTATGVPPVAQIDTISGATSDKPMVIRARKTSNDASATGTMNIYLTGTYTGAWRSGFGIYDDYYILRMQNTTGGPTITVTGLFTP